VNSVTDKANPPEKSDRWCEALYDAEAARLLLYGRALGLCSAEAEDVIHDLFVALLQQENPPDQPAHYLVRAFRNRVLNRKRSLWRRCLAEWESKRWFEITPQESTQERAAMRCLAGLPVEQREVVVLKHWHDLTFAQIADMLKLSPNTVAARYRYGLQKIRTQLTTPSLQSKTDPYETDTTPGVPCPFTLLVSTDTFPRT
jgi:RNA polymerase sigma-70 factor (ECF subfamily)